MPRLFLLQSDQFTSSVRNRDSVVNTCFLLVKQAVALVSFPAWVQRAASVLCLGGHVISLETAAWRHGESSSLICGRRVLCWDGPRVMLLVLWCYGVYKVFDSPSLSQPVLRRESSGPSGSSLRALESELREQEERESADAAHLLKLSDFGHRPQAAGRIRVSVWGGALPMSMGHTLVHFHVTKNKLLPMY